MKFTRSQDGKIRCTLLIRYRMTREQLAILRHHAKRNGESIHSLIGGYVPDPECIDEQEQELVGITEECGD